MSTFLTAHWNNVVSANLPARHREVGFGLADQLIFPLPWNLIPLTLKHLLHAGWVGVNATRGSLVIVIGQGSLGRVDPRGTAAWTGGGAVFLPLSLGD